MLKGRDIREALQRENVHPTVVNYLCTLAEEQRALSMTLIDMANQLNSLIDTITPVLDVVISNREEVEKILKRVPGGELDDELDLNN